MSIIELEIRSSKFVFKFEFSRRINFIKGNSGVGKSTFYELLDRAVNRLDSDILVKSTYSAVPFSRSLLATSLSGVSDVIYVIDDLDLINDKQFNELLSKRVSNNLWFVIMSREDVELKTTLTFSTQSLFKLVNDGGTNYWIEPLFRFNNSDGSCFDNDSFGCRYEEFYNKSKNCNGIIETIL